MNWDFPCSDPVDISIDSWASGTIAVSGEPTSTVSVEVAPARSGRADDLLDEVKVWFDDGTLYVRGPRIGSFRRRGLDLTIKAPTGSTCAAKTAAADLSCIGDISALAVQSASGDITADEISGDVTVQSASGDVLLSKVGGDISLKTASGDIQARRIEGEAQVTTASGDVEIGYCPGPVAVRTASGDVSLSGVAAGSVELYSSSGDMDIAVVPGIGVYLDLASTSGDISSDLDEGDGDAADAALQIRCRTLSGDIRVTRAHGAAS